MRQLLEDHGAKVIALAVVIYQPTPNTRDFGDLPLYHLTKLDSAYYANSASCDLCRRSVPLVKVWV